MRLCFCRHRRCRRDWHARVEFVLCILTPVSVSLSSFPPPCQLSDARLDICANALLALIVCDTQRFSQYAEAFLAQHAQLGGEARRDRLAAALTRLTTSNGLTPELNRPNRQRFKSNMRAFVVEVRGFIQTK